MKKFRPLLVVLSSIVLLLAAISIVVPTPLAYAGGDDVPFSKNGAPEFSAYVYFADGSVQCVTEIAANVDHINVIKNGVLVGRMNSTPLGFFFGMPLKNDGDYTINLVAYSSADELTAKTLDRSYLLRIINGDADYSTISQPGYEASAYVSGSKVTITLSNISWGTIDHAIIYNRQRDVIGQMSNVNGVWTFSKENLQTGAYTWEVYAYSAPGSHCNASGYASVSFNVLNGIVPAGIKPEFLALAWDNGENVQIAIQDMKNVNHLIVRIVSVNPPEVAYGTPYSPAVYYTGITVPAGQTTATIEWPKPEGDWLLELIAYSTESDLESASASQFVGFSFPVSKYIRPTMQAESCISNGEYAISVTGQNIARVLVYGEFGNKAGHVMQMGPNDFRILGLPQVGTNEYVVITTSDGGTSEKLPQGSLNLRTIEIIIP